ncbi:MAG: thioesterase family protein [Paraglaciecola sp.]|uniref:thioesterase family protein n=1 Tax=Paraglaciecola sp. TaxID=1920173 RepID=UPI00273F8A41|nr:thioesterase family protein [Paraglaciecola sp.]MDP5030855.1 thioesterase family protein [Paraglaciecola sp.]MDP5041182.1 thioesterase family protein [Paraglaciecola sp.]MDP5130135.1 thioesterase family protein [Paraglaciecola sp.]
MSQLIQDVANHITHFFNENMPFNQLLGMQVSHLDDFQAEIKLNWHDNLMGNPVHKILHGGVTAAVLDTVGSVAALLYGVKSLRSEAEIQTFYAQLANGGTLDMRVDYLRPGKGQQFIASAQVIRRGNKVAVCRMDLHNEANVHIATGTATYII